MWIDDDDDEDIKEEPELKPSAENSENVPAEVIYKVERPFLKIGLWISGIFVAVCGTLFATGFIMGLADINPSNVDPKVLTNQWDRIMGKEGNSEPQSELVKVDGEE